MDTKSEIITIAKAEFMEMGFQEASMRKIASKVGITATALFKLFPEGCTYIFVFFKYLK